MKLILHFYSSVESVLMRCSKMRDQNCLSPPSAAGGPSPRKHTVDKTDGSPLALTRAAVPSIFRQEQEAH
jgi:hypothetical protein|eukprot:COSAG01_NODE_685_length_14250_cov_18.752032_1_plen_70_part_00